MQNIEIAGYEGQNISVELPNGFGSPKLFINNQPAPAGVKKGQYSLRRNDGVEEAAFFKNGFPDPVPTLMVGGNAVKLAPPLEWYQWIWAGIPMLLILLGGGLGGMLGAVATITNAQLMRSNLPVPLRYVLSGVVTFVAFAIFAFIILMIQNRGGVRS